jgi:exocyst complex component 4
LLEKVKKEQAFTFEEYRSMLNLQCGFDQGQAQDVTPQTAADKNFGHYAIELHRLEMEISGAGSP